jgi:hypothetical protein
MNMTDKKQVVRIEPTNEASKRTKNRIRERGPIFKVERHHLDGNTWLLREVFPNEESGQRLRMGTRQRWIGWLPVNEFKVIEKVNR